MSFVCSCTFKVFHKNANTQDSANSIRDKYGSLNLLINASGVLSIPNVLHPGTLFPCFMFINLSIVAWTLSQLIMMMELINGPFLAFNYGIREANHLSSRFFSTETTLSKVQRSSLLLAYDINAVGPILVIKVQSFSFFML